MVLRTEGGFAMKKTVRAHTNIALIKYWGKQDKALKIPFNDSLSLTLDKFYTDTSVEYDSKLDRDYFILDGKEAEPAVSKRVFWFMNRIREKYDLKSFARIESFNHVPKEAGLASSASAFAALAKAATLDLNLSAQELSQLARLGSGSASRSIYGGFVRWQKGSSDETSFAKPLELPAWEELRMLVCIVNDQSKPFSSSYAMDKTSDESVYFPAWVKQSALDMEAMIKAIKDQSIVELGNIAQANALRMHASLMAVNMWYFEPDTLKVMNYVRDKQKEIPVYFTMDAGPNVKLLTLKKHVEEIKKDLGHDFELIECQSGVGAYVL